MYTNPPTVKPTYIYTNPPTIKPTYIYTNPPTIKPTVIVRPTTAPTVTPCVNGVQTCASECGCGQGYYECNQGQWNYRELAGILFYICSWYYLSSI